LQLWLAVADQQNQAEASQHARSYPPGGYLPRASASHATGVRRAPFPTAWVTHLAAFLDARQTQPSARVVWGENSNRADSWVNADDAKQSPMLTPARGCSLLAYVIQRGHSLGSESLTKSSPPELRPQYARAGAQCVPNRSSELFRREGEGALSIMKSRHRVSRTFLACDG
jgi:hypothetical protein